PALEEEPQLARREDLARQQGAHQIIGDAVSATGRVVVLVDPAVQLAAESQVGVDGSSQRQPERRLDLVTGLPGSRTIQPIVFAPRGDTEVEPEPMTLARRRDIDQSPPTLRLGTGKGEGEKNRRCCSEKLRWVRHAHPLGWRVLKSVPRGTVRG